MTCSVATLNKTLVEMIASLKDQPQGTKSTLFADKSIIGVKGSEDAAKLHSSALKKNSLKETLETLAVDYKIAPALMAGMGSRESCLGAALQKSTSIYWGWGDFSQRFNEKEPTYHGFGILQLDRLTAPFQEVREELNRSLGKTQLNPYQKRWLEWGLKVFMDKFEKAVSKFPNISPAEQLATAVSHYNGGKGLEYPKNDEFTTGKDYANDTLIRARWYAQNWDAIA